PLPGTVPGTNAIPLFRGPPPVAARAFTNLPTFRTNLTVPSTAPPGGVPPAIAGAQRAPGAPGAPVPAPGGPAPAAGPTVATPPATLTAVDPTTPGSPAE